ncbi:MAG: twin-arginine translocase subunit TatC [Candidatus Marinimicrobia bacterium]|nr:twin-arginine translocase subunit TatC [Candidatus Neomarinimicrobiota bacterium]|tara:strand:- start:1645 stop:2373 length:729 start_codon:yes stop_codon:yes gene_type:complete
MNDPNKLVFWDHLEELRWRLFKCIFSIIIFSIISFIYSDILMEILIAPTKELSVNLNLQVLKVTSMFTIKLGIALMGGFILSIPIVIFQFWQFVSPAIEDNYTVQVIGIVLFSSIFFFSGLSFAYTIIIPYTLSFFTSMTFENFPVNYNYTLDGYLSYILWLILSCGLLFQLPVVTFFFSKIGLLTPSFLRHYRKYIFVFFLIISAILTPPDPLSQILIVIPLMILYEFSIFMSWLIHRNSS